MNRFAIPNALAVAVFPALFVTQLCSGQVVWTHSTTSSIGPANWGKDSAPFATCGATTSGAMVEVGLRQTPIDLDTSKVTRASAPVLTFQYLDAPMEVENTGHVVEVVYPAGSTLRLGQLSASNSNDWAQASDEYQLLQFHFHVPSEHTVDGVHASMELHLVHKNQLGDLAVVGVLMQIGTDPNVPVDSILNLAPSTAGSMASEGNFLNATQLLPDDKSYFMYSGSLTTPPCTEGVRWFVMKNPVTVSAGSVQQMHKIVSLFPGYDGFPNNNRPIVPSHDRPVVANN